MEKLEMPGRPGRLFLVAIPVDDHFAIRFPLALLANVWLSTALAFQTGFVAAVKAGDGLTAALHTPIWVRSHFEESRAFLLYHRDDFAHGNWPQDLKDRVVRQGRLVDAAYKRLARDTFGGVGAKELRLARFVLADAPKAAVGPYLRQGVPPPKQELFLSNYTRGDPVRDRRWLCASSQSKNFR